MKTKMIGELTEIATPLLITLWSSAKFYLFWTSMHFVAINLYQYYCAERSIWGYFVSSITTQFPHCKALRWVTDISVTTLDHYWMLIIAATVSKCTGILGGQLVKTNK
tara:strand:- start:1494 stop:1817 length:324 start_codon:yes stop_codon:yes gene_type:complete